MIHPALIPHFPEGTPEAVRRFAWAIAGLCEAIRRAFAPNSNVDVPALQGYFLRTRNRFARLLALLKAGVAPRIYAPRPKREETPRKTPRLRLPGRKGWLGHEIGWFGRGYAQYIEQALNDPETAVLIAGSPRAQRLLRPTCRMLGLAVPAIAPLPARPRKPRPAPKPRRLTRTQREAILWYPNSEGKPMKLLPRRLPRD